MRALACSVAVCALVGAAQLPQPPPGTRAEKKLALGDALRKTLEQRDGLVMDTAVLAYVWQLEAKLAGAAQLTPLDVRVTKSAKLYAALLPNRSLYLSAGLVLRAENGAELAGLLAHEHAHSLTVGVIDLKKADSIALRVGNCVLASSLVPFRWSESMRDAEATANRAAIDNLKTAGYDPASMLDFLSKLAYENPGWSMGLDASDLEAARMALESEPLPTTGYVVDSSSFGNMHERLDRLTSDQRHTGITVSPSLVRARP